VSDNSLTSTVHSLATSLTSPTTVVLAAIVLTVAALFVRAGAARPFRQLLPAAVYVAAGILAADTAAFLFGCEMQKAATVVNLCAGVIFAALACCTRSLSYLGLGFGAGAAVVQAALLASSAFLGAPLHWGIATGCWVSGGLLGALLMILGMPPAVKARAQAARPNVTISVELPFSASAIYYELLNPHAPLGASGEFTVDQWETVDVPGGGTRPVVMVGARRVARLPNGTTESELLLANAPSVIVWKQTASNLEGVNMHGGGFGDEPGVKIELLEVGRTCTKLTLEYFYAELSESFNLWSAPRFSNVTSGELGRRMTEQMRARGHQPLDEPGAARDASRESTSLPAAQRLPAAGLKAMV